MFIIIVGTTRSTSKPSNSKAAPSPFSFQARTRKCLHTNVVAVPGPRRSTEGSNTLRQWPLLVSALLLSSRFRLQADIRHRFARQNMIWVVVFQTTLRTIAAATTTTQRRTTQRRATNNDDDKTRRQQQQTTNNQHRTNTSQHTTQHTSKESEERMNDEFKVQKFLVASTS